MSLTLSLVINHNLLSILFDTIARFQREAAAYQKGGHTAIKR
jgi:hypothetical protein